ncbi:HNH endonuclease [uncultured Sphingomonas sp.]|uniref:HNH endonuclease signature motif containing protein n=1 Tax=uncultured Sphingomonas sp. TaxID=158754 RepID=UPI0025E5DB46|nr:HNH endonuclease [uncultured Sphingomonas sp.]
MTKQTYEQPRPTLPADIRRSILVEAGHACAVKNCNEHTYLDIHHIDHNRENNSLDNLILLCRKHHGMAHDEVIDRKSLRAYKELLKGAELSQIQARLSDLETALNVEKQNVPEQTVSDDQPASGLAEKSTAGRNAVLHFALYHVAISRYEADCRLYFERNVEFRSGEQTLTVDGLHVGANGEHDTIVEVFYIRKPYLDSPAYASFVHQKAVLYELLTGRVAKGVLLAVVGRERMLGDGYLSATAEGVANFDDVSLQVYSCEQVGFHPGPISAAVIGRNSAV